MDFSEIVNRLDARMARVEEHLGAASEQVRRLQSQFDGALTEMRGMRADLMAFVGVVQGFGNAYDEQLAALARRVDALERRDPAA